MRVFISKFVWIIPLVSIIIYSCQKEITLVESNVVNTIYDSLSVSSEPVGADIYINGMISGYKTPAKIKWIEKKDVTVKLKLSPFCDWESKLTSENLSQPLFYDFWSNDQNFGAIDCVTDPPGAKIYLNYVKTEFTTPYTFERLRPGTYNITFKKTNHRSDSSTVTVSARQNNPYYHNSYCSGTLIDTTYIVEYTRETGIYGASHVTNDLEGHIIYCVPSKGVFILSKNYKYLQIYEPFLPSGNVKFLYADPEGNQWVLTSEGLTRISPESVFTYTPSNSKLPNLNIRSIINSGGITYFGTNAGLYKRYFDRDGKEIIDDIPALAKTYNDNDIVSLASLNGLYVFTGKPNIAYYSSVTDLWNNVTYSDAFRYKPKYSAVRNKKLYSVSDRALFEYSGTNWIKIMEFASGNYVTGMYTDRNNNLFVYGNKGITILKADGTVKEITQFPGLTVTPWIFSLAVDAEKNIWLATSVYGLVKIKSTYY